MKSATKTFTGWVDAGEKASDIINYGCDEYYRSAEQEVSVSEKKAKYDSMDAVRKVRVTITVEDV